MKFNLLVISILLIVSILNADTIILKSGEVVEGVVISHSKKYLILQDSDGNTIKIFRSDIEEMKLDKIVSPSRNEGMFIKLNAVQCHFREEGIQDYVEEKYKDDISYGGQIGYRTISNYAAAFGFDYIQVEKDTYKFTIIPITFDFFFYMDIFGKDILDPYLIGGISLYRYYGDVRLRGEDEYSYSSGYTFGAQAYIGLKFKYFLFIEGGYNTAVGKKQGDSYSLGTLRIRSGIQIQF